MMFYCLVCRFDLAYACTHWVTEANGVKGQFYVGRNASYFMGKHAESRNGVLCVFLPYRHVTSLELIPGKRLLAPDSIQIGVKKQNVLLLI